MAPFHSGHHALVIGASGLIGWSVINQHLQPYPVSSPFNKITALVNRPLKTEDSFWPSSGTEKPELSLTSGVNLLCEDDEFARLLEGKVHEIGTVSHVYYFAFKEDKDSEKEVALNVSMMRRVVRAVKFLSKSFQFFVYPGGTRGYGMYRPNGVFPAPLTEDLADRLPAGYLKTVAYPNYRSTLAAESSNQPWTWCEVVPDAIIGFTPNGSGFSLAGHWALVHGEGAGVPFPGTIKGYDAKFTETSATTLARVAIHASLHPAQFRERIFNVADTETPSTMRERWPQIASWFGLVGVAPALDASTNDPKPSDFVKKYESRLKGAGVKGVDIWNSAQLDSYGYWLTFNRQLSLGRLREAGFGEEVKPEVGWWEAFEMFKKAGVIG